MRPLCMPVQAKRGELVGPPAFGFICKFYKFSLVNSIFTNFRSRKFTLSCWLHEPHAR